MFKDRRFVYSLSLVLGGIGFISTYFIHSPYLLFVSFMLIGCAWAAMLALPFTILTNALSGGHMGTYLGLFNGTICIPQIVAAALGGSILALFTPEGALPPEINMLVMAGVMLIIGAFCVYLIKETGNREKQADNWLQKHFRTGMLPDIEEHTGEKHRPSLKERRFPRCSFRHPASPSQISSALFFFISAYCLSLRR